MKWNLALFDDQDFNLEVMMDIFSPYFNVIVSSNPGDYKKILEENNIHVFLLDVHMPKMSGYELYERIVEHPLYSGCPIIFISGDESDKTLIQSLDRGGVDFIRKGTSAEEFILRIKNKVNLFLRATTVLELGSLYLNFKEMRATLNGKDLDLTLLELRMLSYILRAHPKNLTRSELIQKIWGEATSVKPGTINAHFTNLKPKIEGWDYQIKIRGENIVVSKAILI